MKIVTTATAAKRLNIDEKEVRSMCKNGYLELGDIPGQLPGVTEQSICEFLGEDYEQTEPTPAQKKRGRQPTVLSHEEASKLLDMSFASVVQMAFDEILEEWDLPNSIGSGVTKRSVDAFMKDAATKQSEEDEESDVTDINVGETFEKMQPVEEIRDKENLDDSLDEEESASIETQESAIKALLTLAKNDEESFDNLIHSVAATLEKENAITAFPIPEELTVTMTKGDFNAHLNVASMKAEIEVYRSLKSFERR